MANKKRAPLEIGYQNNYGLFSRIMMAKISPNSKVDVYMKVSPKEVVEKRLKNIRLVRLDSEGRPVRHTGLLDYFDVYMHHLEDGTLVSNEGDFRVSSQIKGSIYYTCSGRSIKVMPLEYIKQLNDAQKGLGGIPTNGERAEFVRRVKNFT